MRPLVKKAIVRAILFTICGCVGGPLFSSIEYRGDQKAEKKALLQSLNKTMSIKYNMTAQDFENFTKLSFKALSPAKPSWNIEEGMQFTFQTITTIGYGHITPVTQLGQIICIFYGLIGIPITLLALKSVGELIKEGLTKLIRKFETRLLKREQVYHCEAKCAALSFSITVAIICFGALLSMQTSHWTFVEGIYFWFISFTTVGFGDYVPPTTKHFTEESKTKRAILIKVALNVFYSVWFLPGLCMVSSVISSIQDTLEKNPYQGMCFGCLARQSYVVDVESTEPWPIGSFRVTDQPASNNIDLLEISRPAEGFIVNSKK